MEAARERAPPDAARSSPPLWLSFDKCTAKKRGRQLAPSMRHKENERDRVTSIQSSEFEGPSKHNSLTVSAHACRDALLEAAVLAAVPVDAQYGALLILGAGPILNLLLDRAAEEALKRNGCEI